MKYPALIYFFLRREVEDMRAIVEGLLSENNNLRSKLKGQASDISALEKAVQAANYGVSLAKEEANKNMLALVHARFILNLICNKQSVVGLRFLGPRTEIKDLETTNEALLSNLEHMTEKINAEKMEMETLNRRAFLRIAEEVHTMRDTAEKDILQLNSAHTAAISELQAMIEELISTRAAETNLARREADRLGKDLAQMLKENMECFQLLQELTPRSELESTRLCILWEAVQKAPCLLFPHRSALSGATCSTSRQAR
jgi:hypothetical protein